MEGVEKRIAALEWQVQKQQKVNHLIIGAVMVISITNCFLTIKINRVISIIDNITVLIHHLMN